MARLGLRLLEGVAVGVEGEAAASEATAETAAEAAPAATAEEDGGGEPPAAVEEVEEVDGSPSSRSAVLQADAVPIEDET